MRIRRRRLRDALVAVGCVVAVVDPCGEPAGRVRFAAAIVLLLLGSLLHFWSKGCLEQNQRLVTAGPYRFTRNPFYLANGLIDVGLCALIGRVWVAVPFLVLWWLAYRDTIQVEEERLATLFPEAFARYAAAVPRLVPTGRALPRGEAVGSFTLGNPALAAGSEYARILGVWVAAATIVAWDWVRGMVFGLRGGADGGARMGHARARGVGREAGAGGGGSAARDGVAAVRSRADAPTTRDACPRDCALLHGPIL
ncbi:MAG: isoprenylcysteine carboxylmethyltransferase family protein [Deltaproteobacteria bacterium]|nr:isoprenylcysteine carboxylmethyltransferase family protein [Deltaproteobacteria bacterium]